ncbi:hypothetical protein PENTCL1PPCAC_5362, partial [Pristionchus entomophagus]
MRFIFLLLLALPVMTALKCWVGTTISNRSGSGFQKQECAEGKAFCFTNKFNSRGEIMTMKGCDYGLCQRVECRGLRCCCRSHYCN